MESVESCCQNTEAVDLGSSIYSTVLTFFKSHNCERTSQVLSLEREKHSNFVHDVKPLHTSNVVIYF